MNKLRLINSLRYSRYRARLQIPPARAVRPAPAFRPHQVRASSHSSYRTPSKQRSCSYCAALARGWWWLYDLGDDCRRIKLLRKRLMENEDCHLSKSNPPTKHAITHDLSKAITWAPTKTTIHQGIRGIREIRGIRRVRGFTATGSQRRVRGVRGHRRGASSGASLGAVDGFVVALKRSLVVCTDKLHLDFLFEPKYM